MRWLAAWRERVRALCFLVNESFVRTRRASSV